MKVFIDTNILLKLDQFKFDVLAEIFKIGTPVITNHVSREIRKWPTGCFSIFKKYINDCEFQNIEEYQAFDHFALSRLLPTGSIVCTLDCLLLKALSKISVMALTISQDRSLVLYKSHESAAALSKFLK
jgi:rRNA-processing protein FCF1